MDIHAHVVGRMLANVDTTESWMRERVLGDVRLNHGEAVSHSSTGAD